MSEETQKQAVQTTGHAWDGDLQEFNNPLPRWWLWGFYATVVFALIYWVLYPAWPVGKGYTTGILNDITYTTADGQEVVSHWNTRALFMKEMQEARAAQQAYLDELKAASYREIAVDRDKSAFAYSMAKVLFADNCAACHQAGGAGIIGRYPNLADDSWLWGGSFAQIEQTIRKGRHGFMPDFRDALNEQQIDDVASYVLSLSGIEVDAEQAARGKEIFSGPVGGCFACHTQAGTGMVALGSANLTDSIWTIADINGAEDLAAKKAAVRAVITHGVKREMPAWENRLDDMEIRILTFYVHQLGGGK
ncbi:MAG TPA: cytochrome-c oxidase, cbb3-type subunit III [Gammaproteobacteria bacterium]|nr:cytochrome-c oxidase, cbb3-type subunit III [Gammaproteobacteria bacterium]